MIEIPLTRGYTAKIDDCDVVLCAFKWTAFGVERNGKRRIYAVREVKGERILLHHAIIGRRHGMDVDHIDSDTLNNQRSNLRFATRSQNNANGRKQVGRSSRFKGVHWHSQVGKWTAQIRKRHLGLFKEEVDAA